MSSKREFCVDGVPYSVVIGRINVKIRHGNTSKVVSFAELTGMSWHDIERMIWKKSFSLTPKVICDYIRAQPWAARR